MMDTYTCPWCPVVVVAVDVSTKPEAARVFMERHLDAHQVLGRPKVAA